MTAFSGGAPSIGRITHALDDRAEHAARTPARPAKPSQYGAPRVDHRPGDERREHQHPALGEVDDPRGAPDQHQRQRDRGVDRAVGDAVEGEVDEALHGSEPQVGVAELVVAGQHARASSAATTRPSASTTPRSATDSALRAFCSTSSTVSPVRSRRSRSSAMICAATRGASPSDGSSSSSSRGRAISARPIDEHLALAAGERAGRLAARARASAREQLVDLARARALGVAPPQPAEAQVLLDGQLGDHAAALGHVRHARGATMSSGAARAIVAPVEARSRPARRARARRACAAASSCPRRWRRAPR